jgi:DNA repair protein RecN (Recombination protein N)
VLCITHLPQIAAHGSTHYCITKAVRHGRTVTSVARVAGSDREAELARMIGGAAISPAVVASAREMLATRGGNAGAGKQRSGSGSSPQRQRR